MWFRKLKMFFSALFVLSSRQLLSVRTDFPCVAPIPDNKRQLQGTEPLPNFTLRQIIVLTRHGARSPIASYNKTESDDWYCDDEDENAWAARFQAQGGPIPRRQHMKMDSTSLKFKPSCPPGGLTTEGMQQHYELGQFLRRVYVDNLKFLPETYDPRYIYVRSSEVDRCIRSAMSLLSGLYPAVTPNDEMTIETGHHALEMLHPTTSYCAELKQAWNEWVKTPEYLAEKNRIVPYLQPIADSVNLNMSAVEANWMYIGDWMATVACTHHQFNELVNQTVLDAGMDAVEFYSHGFFSYKRGIAGSVIMREIMRIIDNHIAGKNNYKFALLSAHDVSIVAALKLLGYNNSHWSPFRSYFITQLWEDQNEQLYLRFVYNNEPLEVDFMDNKTLFPLSRFRPKVADYLNHCHEFP